MARSFHMHEWFESKNTAVIHECWSKDGRLETEKKPTSDKIITVFTAAANVTLTSSGKKVTKPARIWSSFITIRTSF